MLLGSSGEGSGRQSTLQDRREGCRRRAHVCRECFCSHQSRTATSTSNMATTVWNFFSPTPLAALAQKLRALARKACRGICFRARASVREVFFVTISASGPPPFGTCFRRRPWRQWRRSSTRWLERRAFFFVHVRACARSFLLPSIQKGHHYQYHGYLCLEVSCTAAIGGAAQEFRALPKIKKGALWILLSCACARLHGVSLLP